MASPEPINLREWNAPAGVPSNGHLFTCGRPGRGTYGRKRLVVPDDVIDAWAYGLPDAEVLQIVSLLGRKTDGFSEFDYYPFRSSKECGLQPKFEEWLAGRYGRRFVVDEYPTVDAQGLPRDVLEAVTEKVRELLVEGCTVVVMDSAGAERRARVCEKLGYSRTPLTARD